MKQEALEWMEQELFTLKDKNNLRQLPSIRHEGRWVVGSNASGREGQRMLNLSSNDYLGLANDIGLRREFLNNLTPETFLPSSSSSRLLTGNFVAYEELEALLAESFGTEAALVLGSGYHANTGILPAISDARTLILADKLVHASLIDGIRLSVARCIRYRHNDIRQLERLLTEHYDTGETGFHRIIIVTESIFSMDGDEADLRALVSLKRRFPGVMLYVDEAHAFGVRGPRGLGCAEEQGCIPEIDFLVGTFGKALASSGAYIVCRQTIREYLVNRMRTFIFTTALPPITIQWTSFLLRRLHGFSQRREHLQLISVRLREAVKATGRLCPSQSHIVPLIVGESDEAIRKAEEFQCKGFYALPVRPPTVPEGTSRIRFSLTGGIYIEELEELIRLL